MNLAPTARATAERFKAFAHPTRLAILNELVAGPKCVTDTEEFLTAGQANISQHLAVLRHAGLVDYAQLPAEVRNGIDLWFRCISGALVEQDFLDSTRAKSFSNPRVLWSGRNARTGHASSICAVTRTEKL